MQKIQLRILPNAQSFTEMHIYIPRLDAHMAKVKPYM